MSSQAIQEMYKEEVLAARRPEHGVDALFVNRWSTRAFQPYELSSQELFSILEAAQYSPSANNMQPWRFYIAKSTEQKALFNRFIVPRNVVWSEHASAYILLASDSLTADGKENRMHAFDTGAAWQAIALQANILGLSTRAMGGFDHAAAKQALQIPEHIIPQVVIAVGKPGTLDQLDESFHQVNKPTPRKALEELIISYEVK